MLCKRCLNLSGEYMNPIKPDTLWLTIVVGFAPGHMHGDWRALPALHGHGQCVARLANRVQLTTDGHKAYPEAVEGAFAGDVDYAQIVKPYGGETGSKGHEKKYSSAECTGIKKRRVESNPDMGDVSMSFVERQNLTMRMGMRRFTRLTNAFSRKLENHIHMLNLYFVH